MLGEFGSSSTVHMSVCTRFKRAVPCATSCRTGVGTPFQTPCTGAFKDTHSHSYNIAKESPGRRFRRRKARAGPGIRVILSLRFHFGRGGVTQTCLRTCPTSRDVSMHLKATCPFRIEPRVKAEGRAPRGKLVRGGRVTPVLHQDVLVRWSRVLVVVPHATVPPIRPQPPRELEGASVRLALSIASARVPVIVFARSGPRRGPPCGTATC